MVCMNRHLVSTIFMCPGAPLVVTCRFCVVQSIVRHLNNVGGDHITSTALLCRKSQWRAVVIGSPSSAAAPRDAAQLGMHIATYPILMYDYSIVVYLFIAYSCCFSNLIKGDIISKAFMVSCTSGIGNDSQS